MNAIADRITVEPAQCGGRPCIRGMRIRVSDVLHLLRLFSSLPAGSIIRSWSRDHLD
jgi:uncharacterized protein (DUF433 family)